MGKVSISSQPSGAIVYVDNLVKGKTPCLIEDVIAGKHTISVEMQGYSPWSKEVYVNGGSTITLSATLSSTPNVKATTPKPPLSLSVIPVLGALGAVSVVLALRWRRS
jgi:hypothetical protein